MKTIERTLDAEAIKKILSTDNLYDSLVFDGSPSLEDYVPDVVNKVSFILKEDTQIAGMIFLDYMNYVLWTPHIFIFEKFRGNGSEEWGKQVVKYMLDRCRPIKFLAFTPYNAAKAYAERVGFKNIAVLKNSVKKGGQILNQYMLELDGEEE